MPLNARCVRIEGITRIIQNNFTFRDTYKELPKNWVRLYRHANTLRNLKETVKKEDTNGYVFLLNGRIKGVVIFRTHETTTGKELRIHRLHVAHDLDPKIKGVGRMLLTAAALKARANHIFTLRTYAAMPAKSYFETLKWSGNVVTNTHFLRNVKVELDQFACSYNLRNFKGFGNQNIKHLLKA